MSPSTMERTKRFLEIILGILFLVQMGLSIVSIVAISPGSYFFKEESLTPIIITAILCLTFITVFAVYFAVYFASRNNARCSTIRCYVNMLILILAQIGVTVLLFNFLSEIEVLIKDMVRKHDDSKIINCTVDNFSSTISPSCCEDAVNGSCVSTNILPLDNNISTYIIILIFLTVFFLVLSVIRLSLQIFTHIKQNRNKKQNGIL